MVLQDRHLHAGQCVPYHDRLVHRPRGNESRCVVDGYAHHLKLVSDEGEEAVAAVCVPDPAGAVEAGGHEAVAEGKVPYHVVDVPGVALQCVEQVA